MPEAARWTGPGGPLMPAGITPDGRAVLWQPNSAPQMRFLETGAYDALYGGAAGGGKSDALLMGALRYKDHPRYAGLLLRRTFPELAKTLIPRSQSLYPSALGKGASFVGSPTPMWRLPAGGRIYFGNLEDDGPEGSVKQYQSAEFQYIGWDEKTHFTEFQFKYMLSRLRGPPEIPAISRGATNPGGIGHPWVLKRYAPWLDRSESYRGPRAASGQVMYYQLHEDGREQWVGGPDDKQACRCEHRGEKCIVLTRVFVLAKAVDNPALPTDYVAKLAGLPALERARLRDADWLASPAAGKFFKKSWFKHVAVKPSDADIVRVVRRWDFAATEPDDGTPDPDWTRGVKMAKLRTGRFVILDVKGDRVGPAGVEKLVEDTAHEDGRGVQVIVPEDPGSAGKVVAARFISLLAGYDVRADRETGDKVTRAGPLSAQVEGGNVDVLRGSWNEEYLDEMAGFPEWAHDDCVDASSGAFNALQPTAEEEALERRLAGWTGGVTNG